MNGDIVGTFVEITYFHAVSVFFKKAKSSFDSSSERLQFLIDQTKNQNFVTIFANFNISAIFIV